MKRLFAIALIAAVFFAHSVLAEEMPKPDDRVIFDVTAEDWVVAKTARVTINVEAAVSATNAGTMRGDMMKAVNDVAKGDWRLTSFNRSQDQTGLERWSALYEARLPENFLNGLGETTRKVSKAGLQLSVGDISFTPTLEEMEAARSALRERIYKQANDQLATLNTAMPGRTYRIAVINFNGNDDEPAPMPHIVRGYAGKMMAAAVASVPEASSSAQPMERAEKIMQTAHIVLAALPSASVATETKK